MGIMNQIIELFFLRAMHNKKIDANDKIKECRYANGVPDTG
tara:strand:+ start:341 stop:463 length:123 start_codon:yes stop_codon:yes gene_type:complete